MSHILYQVPRRSIRTFPSPWAFQPALDRSAFQPAACSPRTQNPALDVYQDETNFTVRLEAPGLKQEDFSVALDNGALTVGTERREPKVEGETGVLRNGRVFGKFERKIELPAQIDAACVTAAYENGVLTVTLPKAAEAKPRQIEIK